MEAVVLKALGEVHDLQTGSFVELGEVNQELVSDATLAVLVSECVVSGEAVGHVVGVEQGDLGGIRQTSATKHLDVCPGDGQDRRAAEGGSRDSLDGLVTTSLDKRVRREERSKMLGDADRARARSLTACNIKMPYRHSPDTRTTTTVRTATQRERTPKASTIAVSHMAKVLCKFMWQTSPPQMAGFVKPTCALRLAPSR